MYCEAVFITLKNMVRHKIFSAKLFESCTLLCVSYVDCNFFHHLFSDLLPDFSWSVILALPNTCTK